MKDSTHRETPWVSPEFGDPQGLVGYGGDLSPKTLLRAYAEGVFPWFSPGDPILWWSPDPRSLIELNGLHVSRSLRRTIRQGKFRVTVNQAFGQVIRGCATERPSGTWITESMIEAYESLHRLGHAHSVETWVDPDSSEQEPLPASSDGIKGWTLAGGIYGVTVGALFAGESMFHRVSDASKVALVALVERLRIQGFELFDVQMRTDHTARMGATDIPRSDYLRRLNKAVKKTHIQFD